jgi:hypothetical protein
LCVLLLHARDVPRDVFHAHLRHANIAQTSRKRHAGFNDVAKT